MTKTRRKEGTEYTIISQFNNYGAEMVDMILYLRGGWKLNKE
jgi:hypothetical protein